MILVLILKVNKDIKSAIAASRTNLKHDDIIRFGIDIDDLKILIKIW